MVTLIEIVAVGKKSMYSAAKQILAEDVWVLVFANPKPYRLGGQ